LVALSCQLKLICDVDATAAVSADGAAGGWATAVVVALATFEKAESPALFVARTRYE
jgi:hypothetical protein